MLQLVARRLRDYLMVVRVGMAPLTVSVPILGALTVAERPAYLPLGVVGFCAHVFGFMLNALVDLPLDRTLPALQKKPLVAGRVRRGECWALLVLALVVAAGVFYGQVGASLRAWVVFGGSIALSAVYNAFSKWGSPPRWFVELSLAASVGLLCGVGALMARGVLPLHSSAYALALALLLLLLNSVPSGLKDLFSDAAYGARSFALASGARVEGADRLYIPPRLRLYAALLQLALAAALAWLVWLYRPQWWVGVLAGILLLYGALHLRMLLFLDSFLLLRRSKPLLSGYYHYAALLVLLLPQMPPLLRLVVGLAVLQLLFIPWGAALRVLLGGVDEV